MLAEAGEPPLYISWLVSAARRWHRMAEAPQGSLQRRAGCWQLSVQMRHSWPQHGAHGQHNYITMQAAGMEFSLKGAAMHLLVVVLQNLCCIWNQQSMHDCRSAVNYLSL